MAEIDKGLGSSLFRGGEGVGACSVPNEAQHAGSSNFQKMKTKCRREVKPITCRENVCRASCQCPTPHGTQNKTEQQVKRKHRNTMPTRNAPPQRRCQRR